MVVAVRRLANRVVLELLCKADLQLGQSSHSVVAYAQASSGDIGPAVLQSTQARPPADVVLLELASREAYLATADALLEVGLGDPHDSTVLVCVTRRGSDALDFARRYAGAVARVVPQRRLSVFRELFAEQGVSELQDLDGEAMWYLLIVKLEDLQTPVEALSKAVLPEDAEEIEASLADATEAPIPMPVLPSFYPWEEVYPFLQPLIDCAEEIKAEAKAIPMWAEWPEYHFRDGGNAEWNVFPLTYTFPATDPHAQRWLEQPCGLCPATTRVLRKIPGLRTALFSRLGPQTRLSGHTGWEDLANHVLRVHLSLTVPKRNRKPSGLAGEDLSSCGVWVNEEVWGHQEGQLLVFDDSLVHGAYNHSDEDRVVLIIDIERPPWLPPGRATGGHTPELDAFIDQFCAGV